MSVDGPAPLVTAGIHGRVEGALRSSLQFSLPARERYELVLR